MNLRVDNETIVVFDLDDTLYPELDYLKSAYIDIAKLLDPINWKVLYAHMLSLFRSGGNTFAYLSSRYHTDISHLLTLYREHAPKIVPRAGVISLLKNIQGFGGRMALVTDGRSQTQRTKIKALGLEPYFDFVVISEEVGTEKPEERNFRLVMEKLGGIHFYYIADNVKKDFLTPNRLGWFTVGILDDGRHIHNATHELNDAAYYPQEFIESFEEVQILSGFSQDSRY